MSSPASICSICQGYIFDISVILDICTDPPLRWCRPYVQFSFSAFKQSKKQWNNQHTSDHACQRHILSIWADTNADKSSFTDQVDMTGIWQEYTCHMSASASAALLGACLALVFQALFAAAPLHCDLLQIFSVLATERLATLGSGWGCPKFHSQVLASYTWLPLI